jgi:hypothetical protein
MNPTTLAAWIAAGAAIVAAVVSLIGVGMTARLARGGKREEWRREYILPLVMELTDSILAFNRKMHELGLALMDGADQTEVVDEVDEGLSQLRKLVIKLSLTASPELSEAAEGIVDQFELAAERAKESIGSSQQEGVYQAPEEGRKLLGDHLNAVSLAVRKDLGLG